MFHQFNASILKENDINIIKFHLRLHFYFRTDVPCRKSKQIQYQATIEAQYQIF